MQRIELIGGPDARFMSMIRDYSEVRPEDLVVDPKEGEFDKMVSNVFGAELASA